jgi:hypothetical protein
LLLAPIATLTHSAILAHILATEAALTPILIPLATPARILAMAAVQIHIPILLVIHLQIIQIEMS